MRRITISLIALTLALAGCASTGPRLTMQQDHDLYVRYAGDPIRTFTYLGRYDSWHAVGRDSLVVWTTFNSAYLLTLDQPCVGLEFAQRIALTSTNRTVSARLDSVNFEGHQRCFIKEIRPVDYPKMRAELRASREAAKQRGT